MIHVVRGKTLKLINKCNIEFEQWSTFERVWLIGFTLIGVVLSLAWKSTLFQCLVFVSGILCVVLSAKGRISAYLFGICNTIGYSYIAYSNQLFGEVGLNLLFFLPTGIIGYFMWHKNIKRNDHLVMISLSMQWFMTIVTIAFVCIVIGGIALSMVATQNTPFLDATTNVLSIVATLLMMKRYREQWLFYIVLNIVTIVMWSIRFSQGSPDGLLMVIMWTAYLINSVYGYYNWSKGMKAVFA